MQVTGEKLKPRYHGERVTRDLGIKADRYLKNGVKEYWILDPEEREIHLWLNRKDSWEKRAGDYLTSGLIPGFTADKSAIFP